MKIADIRGWGYYTGKGHGALGLSDDEARDRMDANAAYIAAAHPGVVIELLDAVERAEDEAAEAKAALSEEAVKTFRESLAHAREVQASVAERQASIRAGARRAPKAFRL